MNFFELGDVKILRFEVGMLFTTWNIRRFDYFCVPFGHYEKLITVRMIVRKICNLLERCLYLDNKLLTKMYVYLFSSNCTVFTDLEK
jgi:hypothetical protein